MDTAQWPQEKAMEERVVVVTNTSDAATCSNSKPSESCKKVKPHKDVEQIINCPRCNSSNTKFCYYNNYSLSQPRYFCKTCRRYWTEGGSLRNIPVGGGSRKNNKRCSNSSPSSSISQSNSSASSKKFPSADHHQPLAPPPQVPNNMNLYDNHQDLNLSNDFKTFSQLIQVPDFENIGNRVGTTYSTSNSFMPMLPNIPGSTTFSGFPLNTADQYHQFMKPVSGHSFSLDNDLGIDNNTTGRHLFPFEDLKLQASHDNTTDPPGDNSDDHHNNGRDNEGDEPSNGFWNGMLGTGPW